MSQPIRPKRRCRCGRAAENGRGGRCAFGTPGWTRRRELVNLGGGDHYRRRRAAA